MEAPRVGKPPNLYDEDLFECDQCGKELRIGDEAYEDAMQFEYYCSEECYLKRQGFKRVIVS